jgi:glycosyltransferase involved in cell wall biosynthesis
VGAIVPHGSSRAPEIEALADTGRDGVLVLPDVSSEERNWLLRHAEAVIYPTAAEGFGLVPFEAAAFGTPTVEVPFGPLAEILPDLPVTAADWSPEALAEATLALLADPALATAQLQAIQRGGERFRWASTAAALVDFYRALLARPARLRRGTSDLEEYA